jgi:hypothetical protein
VLFYDDVMTYRKTKPCTFARRFSREEGIEHLLLNIGGNAGAIVANADFDVFRRDGRQLDNASPMC